MSDRPRCLPHDLLWGMAVRDLPADAPAWARQALERGDPVVVRRAQVPGGYVAVGVRGQGREQRLAANMPLASVRRVLHPEQLPTRLKDIDCSVSQALSRLRPTLDALGLAWGVTGSAGFQLATGRQTLHPGSDLDLILRTPTPFGREQGRALLDQLDKASCRVDLQLQTAEGGVALREWAGGARQVLLKTEYGPRLVESPWAGTGEAAA